MTFPRIRSNWTANAVPTHQEFNQWDQDHANSIDGAAGGAYSVTSPIVLGASGSNTTGLHVTAILQADQFQGTMTSGQTLTVETGAAINISGSPGLLQFGLLAIEQYGLLEVQAGGNAVVQSDGNLSISLGGALTNYGTIYNAPGSVTAFGGASGNPGLLHVIQYGQFLVDAGALCTFAAGLNVGDAANWSHVGNHQFGIGTVTLEGATTQTGPYTKSGANATTTQRWTTIDPASGTYNGPGSAVVYLPNVLAYDEYSIVSTGGIVLPDPTPIPVGTPVTFYIAGTRPVYCNFLPYFTGGGQTPPQRLFQLNSPGTAPISQGHACASASFRVVSGPSGPAWDLGPGSDGAFSA
jgi:hypothetical protein